MNTRVLVVSDGPVGLTADMDLASRGINVVVAELRQVGGLVGAQGIGRGTA